MKKLIVMLAVALCGCFVPEKSIEVKSVIVQIKKMEAYYRTDQENGCKITWEDIHTHTEYTSFTKFGDYCDNYIIGARYQLLMQR